MVKSDAAKEARIAKDQGAFGLMKNKMIVLLRSKAGRLNPQFSGHPEVNAGPTPNVFASPYFFGVGAGEFVEHLFSPRRGAQKFLASEMANESSRIRAAKNSFPRVDLNPLNLLTKPRVPLEAVIFHFGKLGHREK